MQKPQNPFTHSTTKFQASLLSWSILIGFCVMLFMISSCHKGITIKKPEDFFKFSPPGTAEIKSNFYYDITETANIDWLEYLYWTQQVFGNNSEEHKATLTDTLACRDGNFYCLCNFKEKNTYKRDTYFTSESLIDNYFRHPKYSDCPVIGVSQAQALAYSKWRSDRVFEMILVEHNKIKFNKNLNKDNYFTIEKYFNGQIEGVVPDPTFIYYPHYRLPTTEEWRNIIIQEDSAANAFFMKPKNKKLRQEFKANMDSRPCDDKNHMFIPLTYIWVGMPNPFGLYHMRGNVREWTNEPNVCIGGGWADSLQTILKQDTVSVYKPDIWTGFRNVCEWKLYKK